MILESECDLKLKINIVEFFKTGSLYYKLNIVPSFIFSEFKADKWLNSIVADLDECPVFVSTGDNWDKFDVMLSLGISREENDAYHVDLKPWSVETCYGFWVPNQFSDVVNKKNEEKSKALKSHLEKIVAMMNARGKESLADDYRKHLEDIKSLLKRRNLHYKFDIEKIVKKYESYVERLLIKLSDPEKLDKLSQLVLPAGMPDIWEDDICFDAFSNSFYESLVRRTGKSHNYLVKLIRSYLKIPEVTDSDEIASYFINFSKNDSEDWTRRYWEEM